MKLSSIFGTRGARDKPKDSYGGQAYSFFFGRSTSGKNVNERTAMQTTAVYSCVRILAEAVASLPIHVYRYTETGKERVYDHPPYYLLHDEPNLEMTSFVFQETLMSHLLIWGNDLGDAVTAVGAPGWATLVCTQAGTTAAYEPSGYSRITKAGDKVLDGAAVFTARNIIGELDSVISTVGTLDHK